MVSPVSSVFLIAQRNAQNFYKNRAVWLRDGATLSTDMPVMVETQIIASAVDIEDDPQSPMARLFYPGTFDVRISDTVRIVYDFGTVDWVVVSPSQGRSWNANDSAYAVRSGVGDISEQIRVFRPRPDGTMLELGPYSVYITYRNRVARVGQPEGATTRLVSVIIIGLDPAMNIIRGDGFESLFDGATGQVLDVRHRNNRTEIDALINRGIDRPEL